VELSDLKQIWRNEQDTLYKVYSSEEIKHMLRQKSEQSLHKINRGILFDTFLLIITLVIIMGYILVYHCEGISVTMKYLAPACLSIGAYTTYLYIKLYRTLNKVPLATVNLRKTLQHITAQLDQFFSYYTVLTYILMYVGFAQGTIWGVNYVINTHEWSPSWGDVGLFALVTGFMCIILFFACRWMIKWYLNKLYGRYNEQLKAYLAQIDMV